MLKKKKSKLHSLSIISPNGSIFQFFFLNVDRFHFSISHFSILLTNEQTNRNIIRDTNQLHVLPSYKERFHFPDNNESSKAQHRSPRSQKVETNTALD
jgi:hypothetical protein